MSFILPAATAVFCCCKIQNGWRFWYRPTLTVLKTGPLDKSVSASSKKGNSKVNHAPQESIVGCSSPSLRPWACRWRTTNVCDAWPVWRQTYGYFPGCKASPPIGQYQIILPGDRGTCVSHLPRVALNNGEAGIRTRDLLIASLTSWPLSHRAICYICSAVC